MTIYEFNTLNENDKAEYIWQHCSYIGNIVIEKSVLMLYGSQGEQNFFIELEMLENKITKICSFIKGVELNKYLNQIDLLKLINQE